MSSNSDRHDSQTLAVLRLAEASARVNNYCDHAEHNEVLERDWVTRSGQTLRVIGTLLAHAHNADITELYAKRLAQIESKNVYFVAWSSFDGSERALAAKSWRDLQLVQDQHDRCYHPDVAGLTRYEQLRHYAFHVAKLVGGYARFALDPEAPEAREEFISRRLPDTLLFGLKLSTVMSEKLSKTEGPDAVTADLADEQQARALLSA